MGYDFQAFCSNCRDSEEALGYSLPQGRLSALQRRRRNWSADIAMIIWSTADDFLVMNAF